MNVFISDYKTKSFSFSFLLASLLLQCSSWLIQCYRMIYIYFLLSIYIYVKSSVQGLFWQTMCAAESNDFSLLYRLAIACTLPALVQGDKFQVVL